VANERGHALVLPDPALPVVADRGIIDAVASGGVAKLKERAAVFRIQGAATSGRIVSGRLPIRRSRRGRRSGNFGSVQRRSR
jgi:hypothetical protein